MFVSKYFITLLYLYAAPFTKASFGNEDAIYFRRYEVDASENYKFAEQDENFEYVVTLHQPPESSATRMNTVAVAANILEFYWNYPSDGILKGKLVHVRTSTSTSSPSLIPWMGLGVSDYSRLTSTVDLVPGSTAMIGQTIRSTEISSMEQLQNQTDAISMNTSMSVTNDLYRYTLSESFEEQMVDQGIDDSTTPLALGDNEHNFVRQVLLQQEQKVITTLEFSQNLNEWGLRSEGINLFVYSFGPSTEEEPGVSSSFVLDFDKVHSSALNYQESPTDCYSDYKQYDHMVVLPSQLRLYWKLNAIDNSVDIQLKQPRESWLALGVADNKKGNMVGSQAVIGTESLPALDGDSPLKYNLLGTSANSIVAMNSDQQTLQNVFLDMDNGKTILRFTKMLEEENDNEHIISASSPTTFIYAVGNERFLSHHKHAGSFDLNLNSCPKKGKAKVRSFFSIGVWMAHGLFGCLAFAICTPLAVSSVILRKAFPDKWMVVHTYGNMVAGLFSLVGFVIAVVVMAFQGDGHFTENHHITGLVLMLLMSVQIVLGLLRPGQSIAKIPSQLVSDMYTEKRRPWLKIHRFVGVAVLFLGLYQVGNGLNMFADNFQMRNLCPLYLVFLALSGGSVIIYKFYLILFIGEIEKERLGRDLVLSTLEDVEGRSGRGYLHDDDHHVML